MSDNNSKDLYIEGYFKELLVAIEKLRTDIECMDIGVSAFHNSIKEHYDIMTNKITEELKLYMVNEFIKLNQLIKDINSDSNTTKE